MALVEGRPAAAAQEAELALVLDGRVHFRPEVGLDAVDLQGVVVLAVGVHSSEFQQVVLADGTEAGVGCLVLAGRDGFDLVGSGVEGLALFECFVVVGHASADVDRSLVAEDGVAGARDDQLSHFPQSSRSVIALVNVPAPL